MGRVDEHYSKEYKKGFIRELIERRRRRKYQAWLRKVKAQESIH